MSIKIKAYDETFDCDVAVKGDDFIKLYKNSIIIAEFLGISDFSNYSISGGEWSSKKPTLEETNRADIDYILMMGEF